ncbi:S-formylglutathione hydrolase [Nitrococcus mobilis]|uniref:S-formylglutathione hydrolase n=1 Tax=Nitrococcus mobilis Nb-231 TaxID=314278 RepID=A4BR20_9GAMM|nr:S-formylglutathione hydrolase [Nitrococcus mobilis Nb-231]
MTNENVELSERHRCFGGQVEFYRHWSTACNTPMRFSIFLPPQAEHGKVPVLYWLSGLTCTEENFIEKSGAQRYAAEHGIMLVAPDTSPRGLNLPGEDDAYDFGSGAGFYLNATQAPWNAHYRMYDYVVEELPALIASTFPADVQRTGVFGHSMGGHGALTVALRNPERYRSVSAFAPICAPSLSPWGKKAFSAYLGSDESTWQKYNAHHLVRSTASRLPLLVDQGTADQFITEQLMPWELEKACREVDYPLTLRFQAGFDHSYYFISTFMRDHLAYHASALGVVGARPWTVA